MNNEPINLSKEQAATAPPAPQINELMLKQYLETLRAQQNLALGIVGGLIGMLIGTAIWTLVTVVTEYQIGLIAIGIGFLVGMGVRYLGKGFDTSFGIVGGILSGLGCVIGNLLTVLIILSREFDIPFGELLTNLDLNLIVEFMTATFSPMDLLFYALAIYYGYQSSFREISQQELSQFGTPT